MKQERQISLPAVFLERMKRLLGEEYPAFLDSYEKERVQGLRLNPLKWGPETPGQEWDAYEAEIKKKFGLRKILWAKDGYYYEADTRPGRHPLHEAGAYYIQEPSAMAAAALLSPEPGEIVLDLCAAPGGKTTQLAGLMKQAGLLVSNEIHPARARILSQNVERMGIRNGVVTNEDPETLLAHFPEFFHKILVDAPCSGEGMFRKDDKARQEWSPENVSLCARRQGEILDCAAGMLKGGGRLVYSTCTFSPEENEGSVQGFLKHHEEFELEEVVPEGFSGFGHGQPEWIEGGMPELSKTFRIWPHRTEGEGHFLAVLKKSSEKEKEPEKERHKRRKTPDEWEKWCRFAQTELSLSLEDQCRKAGYPVMFGDQLYLVPSQMKDMKGLKILRPGLHLGEYKKNRFEPSHSLALYLKKEQARQWVCLDADGPLIQKYLRGEAIDRGSLEGAPAALSEKGWVLMLADHVSVGWAKLAGNTLKNHYPKGLRI